MARRLVWEKEGTECPKCKGPRTWHWGIMNTIVDAGPQGGWACKCKHGGWIWPREVREDK